MTPSTSSASLKPSLRSIRGCSTNCAAAGSKLTGCGSSFRNSPDTGIAQWQPFAISSRREAVAYVMHEVLGARLRECTALVNAIEGRTIREILSSPDDFKFQSSMTLFGASSSDPEFAVSKFYAGRLDQATIDLLAVNHGLSAAGCDGEFWK